MIIQDTLIYVRTHEVENAKATVILTHGIAEHSGRYQRLIEALNGDGYRVVRYDLRGHGQSQGKRGKLKSFHQMIDDLHAIVLEQKQLGHDKIYLFGHSMGGLIVDLYAVKYGDVNGIIASAASSYFVKDVAPFRYIGYRWLAWVKVKTNFADHRLSTIREVEQAYIDDPFNLKHFYVSLAGQMMISGVRYLNKHLDKYTLPVLILHGGNDPIVPKAFSQRIYDLIPSEDKKIIFYNNSLHEILNDVEQEQVRKDILEWLDERVK